MVNANFANTRDTAYEAVCPMGTCITERSNDIRNDTMNVALSIKALLNSYLQNEQARAVVDSGVRDAETNMMADTSAAKQVNKFNDAREVLDLAANQVEQ